MLAATEIMAVPSYVGMDRMLYEPMMRIAQIAFDASSRRWVRIPLCVGAGLLRLALCIMPVHVLLRVPSSHILLVMLVVLDIIMHPFGRAADDLPPSAPKRELSMRFLRLLSLSQALMLVITLGLCLHAVRLQLWQYLL